MRRNLREWIDAAPTITCHPDAARIYMRSLMDIAALRFRPDTLAQHSLPAAGLPWFMALFGRDSLITSYQMLPFNSGLAVATLRALAEAQGKQEVELTEEEPGRILHELRFGELTHFHERPQAPYYGASDTTPLFLVLLDEYERWTGDANLVRALEPNAHAALNWMDHFGDRDGDGYIEYQRKTKLGLENQCWKDSWNSMLFHDGTLAPTPLATCEIQGYAYDARLRCARLAREIWKDEALAVNLETQAADLKRRFNQDFWIPDRRFFALALDGHKRKVDSLCSNIGHLLWSGIVDDDKAGALRDHLMSPPMFSGWGIRTMAMSEGGYNPIEYHNGTVVATRLQLHRCRARPLWVPRGRGGHHYRSLRSELVLQLAFAGSLLWIRSRETHGTPCNTPRPVSLRRGPPRRRCSASAPCSAWNRRAMC